MKKKKERKVGLSPGSVIYTGKNSTKDAFVRIARYDKDHINEIYSDNFRTELYNIKEGEKIWVDILGLNHTELISKIGEQFQLHPILIENVVDVEQRPKFEEYENSILLIFDSLQFDESTHSIQIFQNAIVFGKNFLISFQESENDSYIKIRERINQVIGRMRTQGPDYLAYAMVDSQVDSYYLVMDKIEEEIELLESNIDESSEKYIRQTIMHLKRELLTARKSIQPLREALGKMSKTDSEFLEHSTSLFIRDVFDHTVYLMELTDNFKDMLSSIYDLYVAQISMRMNNVMKALTIVSSIFIPLSFIASVYGMNFKYMPELDDHYGYFIVIGVMVCLFVGMLVYFKKKGWMDN